jgi:LysR family transcriptional activator of nhaA
MSPWINYHHLNYFRVIATEGSIARAAEKLRLGQPTLSAQLKQFEDTIGVQLFEREHKKLKLTDAGRVALEYANEIFKMGGEMLEVLHDRLVPLRTHVQIGALDSISKRLVTHLVKEALKIGRCNVSILEGKGDELLRELALHKIDLILSNYIPSAHETEKIYSKSVAKMPVIIYGGNKFKSLKNNFPDSLNNVPFIMPTKHSKLRHDLEHYFRKANVVVDVVAETQDVSVQKLLGVDEVGLVPLAEFAAEELIKEKDLFEIGRIPGVFEELYLLSASRKIENPVSGQLMKGFKLV